MVKLRGPWLRPSYPDRGGSPATSEQTGCPSDVRGLCLWDLRHLGQSLVCFLWAAGLQGQRRRAELIWRGSSRPPVRPWWGEQGQGGQGLEKVFLWGREGGKEAPPTEALSFTAEKRRTKLICLWERLTFVPSSGLCAKGGEDAKEMQGSVSDFLEIQSGWGRVGNDS